MPEEIESCDPETSLDRVVVSVLDAGIAGAAVAVSVFLDAGIEAAGAAVAVSVFFDARSAAAGAFSSLLGRVAPIVSGEAVAVFFSLPLPPVVFGSPGDDELASIAASDEESGFCSGRVVFGFATAGGAFGRFVSATS